MQATEPTSFCLYDDLSLFLLIFFQTLYFHYLMSESPSYRFHKLALKVLLFFKLHYSYKIGFNFVDTIFILNIGTSKLLMIPVLNSWGAPNEYQQRTFVCFCEIRKHIMWIPILSGAILTSAYFLHHCVFYLKHSSSCFSALHLPCVYL